MGESKIFTNVVKKLARTPLSRAKNSKKTSELNGSGVGRGKRIRGPRPFVPVGDTNRDKRPMSPLLARLAVGPGTKATYCPGPKGCRDKWPGTKACSVVVAASARRTAEAR